MCCKWAHGTPQNSPSGSKKIKSNIFVCYCKYFPPASLIFAPLPLGFGTIHVHARAWFLLPAEDHFIAKHTVSSRFILSLQQLS